MRAFIIRPFGIKQGIDFNRVVDELIDPALAALEVTGRDTIEILKQGNIRVDMFQRLWMADLVVADLSIHNANVFYELGIRHALRGKRTFLLRSNQSDYPFDLQTDRYLTYDKDNPKASLELLTEALRQTLASEEQDSPVFRSLPDLREPNRSRILVVPRGFREEVELAVANRECGDLGMLAAEAEGFEWESEGLRVVGRAQLKLKDFDGARATWESIREIDPMDLEANTWLGTIYHRLARLTLSDQALQRVLARKDLELHERAEAYALLGRNAKTRWKDDWSGRADEKPLSVPAKRERALRSSYLEKSYKLCAKGFSTDLNHFYSGLNALAMATILIELAQFLPEIWSESFEEETMAQRELDSLRSQKEKLVVAVELSIAAARTRLEQEEKTDAWVEMSAADLACLISKRPGRVADAYRKALAGASDLDKTALCNQLNIYRDLDLFKANVESAKTVPGLEGDGRSVVKDELPRVLLFAGHMIDAPGREKPRFPSNLEGAARQAIQKAIEAENRRPGGVGFGIAGGASGGDILFHEICTELGIPTRLYLALPKNRYIEESVAPADGNWVERFDRLAEKLSLRALAESADLPSWLTEKRGYDLWQRNNLWLLHNALAEGGEQLTLIVLWNGQQGDGPGSIGDLVARARQRHARTVILDANRL